MNYVIFILFYFSAFSCTYGPIKKKKFLFSKLIFYKENLQNKDLLYNLYEDDKMIWFNRDPKELLNLTKLNDLILGNGLNINNYDILKFRNGFLSEDEFIEAQSDLLISDRVISLIKHLKYGVLSPSRVDDNWISLNTPKLNIEEIKLLKNAKDPIQFISSFSPSNPAYIRLQSLLAAELVKSSPDLSLIKIIKVNMERWRWLSASLGSNYVIVNIANAKLTVVFEKIGVLDSRVIIGTIYRQTPVLSSEIEKIIINPSWQVPPTILKEDLLPKIKRSESYLEEHNMVAYIKNKKKLIKLIHKDLLNLDSHDVENLVIIQSPGVTNPLGKTKFYFKNSFGVYLHDTNDRSSFESGYAALSSGCIRVEKAQELKDLLIEKIGGNKFESDDLSSMETKIVQLKKTIPIHIVYFTLWVDSLGKVFKVDDLYNRDIKLFDLLEMISY